MKPTPAQARLLRDMSTEDAYIDANTYSDIEKIFRINCHAYPAKHNIKHSVPTFKACLKNGWMESKVAEVRRGVDVVHFVITESGRKAIMNLLPIDFETKSTDISANDILELLRNKFTAPEWIFLPEFRMNTGYGHHTEQRIDAWALNAYPSKNYLKLGFEIKVSRSDFLREINQPSKMETYKKICNEQYFVCPKDILKIDEIPNGYGLYIIDGNGELRLRKHAEYVECDPPTWGVIASALRREQYFRKEL